MISFEVDAHEQFADIEKDEEKRFFRIGRTKVRTAAARLRKAIRAHAPKHIGSYPPSKQGRAPGTLQRAFVYRVRTRKRDGVIEARVQPKGGIRQKGAQWHITRFLESGTRWIRALRFIRVATLEQRLAIEKDLAETATD